MVLQVGKDSSVQGEWRRKRCGTDDGVWKKVTCQVWWKKKKWLREEKRETTQGSDFFSSLTWIQIKLLFHFTFWVKTLHSVLRDGSKNKYAPAYPNFFPLHFVWSMSMSCRTAEFCITTTSTRTASPLKVCPWQIWSSIPGVTLMELKHPASIMLSES